MTGGKAAAVMLVARSVPPGGGLFHDTTRRTAAPDDGVRQAEDLLRVRDISLADREFHGRGVVIGGGRGGKSASKRRKPARDESE